MNFQELDEFTKSYIECALWSSTDDDGESLDLYCADDIAPETLEQMREDCSDFQGNPEIAELLDAITGSADQNGHDFWLTRNHHGAGFWDRGYGEIGKKLTDAAHVYGEYTLYVGDDGQIYGG